MLRRFGRPFAEAPGSPEEKFLRSRFLFVPNSLWSSASWRSAASAVISLSQPCSFSAIRRAFLDKPSSCGQHHVHRHLSGTISWNIGNSLFYELSFCHFCFPEAMLSFCKMTITVRDVAVTAGILLPDIWMVLFRGKKFLIYFQFLPRGAFLPSPALHRRQDESPAALRPYNRFRCDTVFHDHSPACSQRPDL